MAESKIRITADTAQAERAIANLDKSLGSLKEQGADVAKALAGITAAAAAMGVAILKTLGAAGDLVDAANRLGVSAENLNRLQQAAQLAGVSADTLNASVQRLSANIGEGLAKGTGPAVDAMNRLGIPIQEIARLRPDEQFQRIAERLNAIQNPAERTAAAMDLFGKQGPAILQVANELEKVDRITKDIGFFVGEREIRALDEAGDAIDQLGIIWDAGIKKAVAELAPVILAIVNSIKDGIKEAGGFEGIWKSITSILRTIANVMLILAGILATRLVVGAAQFAVQLGRALVTARGLSLVLSRTPIGLLAAGAAILAEKLGVDLVGAAGDFLDINLDIEGAQQQITDALEESQRAINGNREAQSGFNEAQKKALDTLNDTITKLQQQAQYQRDVNVLGEVEARIRKTVSEENEKLAKVGLTLNEQQRQRLTDAIREEEVAKRLKTAREGLAEAQMKFAVPASREFFAAAKEIETANRALIEAQATGNAELINLEQQRYNQTVANYRQTVTQYGLSLTERGKLDLDYARRVGDIEASMLANKQINGGRETDLYRLLAEEKFKIEEEYQRRRDQLEIDGIQRRLMNERGALATRLSDQEQALLQQQGANERQKAIVDERIKFEKKSEAEKYAFAIDQGAQMFSALGAQNKKAFEAAKAFNIANAIMNTYMAATKALATYPPPFNFIAAAAAIGMGLAQVAQIRSQQYSGRALGGPVMGNTPYIVGENGPELFTPNTTGSITRNSDLGGGGAVTVNFSIVANDTQGFDELLNSRRGTITQIISDAMLERGSRSML